MKELTEAIKTLQNVFDKVNNQLEGIKRVNQYVVVYDNEESSLYYSFTERDQNFISKGRHDIMPSPSINNLKVFANYRLANKAVCELPSFCNGSGERFYGKIVTYPQYLEFYLKEIKNSLKNLSECL